MALAACFIPHTHSYLAKNETYFSAEKSSRRRAIGIMVAVDDRLVKFRHNFGVWSYVRDEKTPANGIPHRCSRVARKVYRSHTANIIQTLHLSRWFNCIIMKSSYRQYVNYLSVERSLWTQSSEPKLNLRLVIRFETNSDIIKLGLKLGTKASFRGSDLF